MNRVRRAIHVAFAAAVALLCTLLFVPMSAAQTGAIDSNKINPSVVWVDVHWDGVVSVDFGEDGIGEFETSTVNFCTGFIVDATGGIATAGHCIEKSNDVAESMMWSVLEDQGATNLTPADLNYKVSLNDPTVVIGQPSSIKDSVFDDDGVVAQVIDYQSFNAGDNALLRVANFDTSAAVLPIATVTPEVLTEVTTIGYPGNTQSISEVNRTNPTYKRADISAVVISDKGVPNLQVDGEIVSGMSGGPALDETGEVVGVNSSGFGTSTQSYITDTQTMRSFLIKNGVDLDDRTPMTHPDMPADNRGEALTTFPSSLPSGNTEDSSDDDSGVPVWSWFVVGGLALVVVGGGAVWKIRQRRDAQSLEEPVVE